MEKYEAVNGTWSDNPVRAALAVADVNISSRDDVACTSQPPPPQQAPVVITTVGNFCNNYEVKCGRAVVASNVSMLIQPPTSTVLPHAVASICNDHAVKATLPTAHATYTTKQPPNHISLSMNAAIDRTVALSQQRREAMIEEGTIIVEDYSSIRIDLDRVDAFYKNLGRGNFDQRFALKYFRWGIGVMAMGVAWIIATPLFFKAFGHLSLHDLQFMPAFPSAFLLYILQIGRASCRERV